MNATTYPALSRVCKSRNPSYPRDSYAPERGISMAAQHASGSQILPACKGACDQGRKACASPELCNTNVSKPSKWSCATLGVCQARSPRCADCPPKIVFAPEAIDYGNDDRLDWIDYLALFSIIFALGHVIYQVLNHTKIGSAFLNELGSVLVLLARGF